MNMQRKSRAKRVIMSVPLKAELHERLARASLRTDLPMIALIRIAVGQYLDEQEEAQ